jgi:exonuclease III
LRRLPSCWLLTSNSNAWSTAQSTLEWLTSKERGDEIPALDAIGIQETRIKEPAAATAARSWCKRQGYDCDMSLGLATAEGATEVSAGVALATREGLGVITSHAEVLAPFATRVLARRVAIGPRQGTEVVSLYLWDSEGLSPRNLALLEAVGKHVGSLDRPYVLMGDWNVEPQALRESYWLQAIRGVVVAPPEATCVLGEGKTYDFSWSPRTLRSWSERCGPCWTAHNTRTGRASWS